MKYRRFGILLDTLQRDAIIVQLMFFLHVKLYSDIDTIA
jgi:hypothetical protein